MFDERSRGTELLDRPEADARLVARSLRLMKLVNSAGGGTRVVRKFLAHELSRSDDRPARILDIGSGDGSIPLALIRWAQKHDYRLEFTCVDHNLQAVKLAREAVKRAGVKAIVIEQADITEYHPNRPFDYAVGSMFFHHLAAVNIAKVIEHLHGFVRKAVLINDLHRSAVNFLTCRLLTLGIDPEIRHDALLSIARSFRVGELSAILSPHDPAAHVETRWFCRVAAVVRFDRPEEPCNQC